jgi:hypothetical protein
LQAERRARPAITAQTAIAGHRRVQKILKIRLMSFLPGRFRPHLVTGQKAPSFRRRSARVVRAARRGNLPAVYAILPAVCAILPAECGILPAIYGILPAKCDILPAIRGILPAEYGILPAECGILPAACDRLPAACGGLPAGPAVQPARRMSRPLAWPGSA